MRLLTTISLSQSCCTIPSPATTATYSPAPPLTSTSGRGTSWKTKSSCRYTVSWKIKAATFKTRMHPIILFKENILSMIFCVILIIHLLSSNRCRKRKKRDKMQVKLCTSPELKSSQGARLRRQRSAEIIGLQT